MIELPRAALIADAIAEHADFFSFGTNDLTQTVFGLSRDDAGKFLPLYVEKGILPKDPFVSIDPDGVGALVRIAAEKGRAAKPGLEARHLRRAWGRSGVHRLLRIGRARLRLLFALSRAGGAAGGGAGGAGGRGRGPYRLMAAASEQRVALILPPKERFTAGGAGAVALILRDLARASPPGRRSEVWGRNRAAPFAGAAFRPVRPTLPQRLLSGRTGAFARAVARALAADPPAVVEAHNRAAVALAIAAALPRTPVVLVLHNEARQSEGLATAAERAAVLQRLAGIVACPTSCVAAWWRGCPRRQQRACMCCRTACRLPRCHLPADGRTRTADPLRRPAGARERAGCLHRRLCPRPARAARLAGGDSGRPPFRRRPRIPLCPRRAPAGRDGGGGDAGLPRQ